MACFILALFVIALDQLSKLLIVSNLELHAQRELIPGVIGLTHVRNTGASFGMLSDMRWLLVGIASAVVILLIVLITQFKSTLSRIGLAAVLGGAVGNLIDRIIREGGQVVDMFELRFVNFAIFNVADCFITIGGVLFILGLFVRPRGALPQHTESSKPATGGGRTGGSSPSSIFGGTVKDLSETKILEEYDIERLLREYNADDMDD